jgi:hypothetical protein
MLVAGRRPTMATQQRRVDLRWSTNRLKRFCQSHRQWYLDLGPRFTTRGIERLYWRHVAASDGSVDVLAEIAGDPRASAGVIRDIWARFRTTNMGVMSALACNPAAPPFMLRQLLRARDATVRDHARKALRKPSRLKAAFLRATTQQPVDIPALVAVAGDPRTPAAVLTRLRRRFGTNPDVARALLRNPCRSSPGSRS